MCKREHKIMPRQKKLTVEVVVCDHTKKVLPQAKLILRSLTEKHFKDIELKFDERRQKHCASDIKPGEYILRAEAEAFEPQQREVQVDLAGLKTVFILGKKGMPFYYKHHVKVPFEPRNDLLAVAVDPGLSEEHEHALNDDARKLGLRPQEISTEIKANHVRLFRSEKNLTDAQRQSIQEQLEKHPDVRRVGPVVQLEDRGLSFLTNELLARFKPNITHQQAHETAKALNLDVVREIPHIPNGFLFRTAGVPKYDNLNVCDTLVRQGVVDYAEPNLFVTAVRCYIPNDTKLTEQPHHLLINSEEAWNTTMGNHDILIAVMDDGCDTDHEDLTNPPGTTWTKVVNQFNFTSYSSTLTNTSHGTRSCGIATAVADNTKGVAGVAPGCQLMPLQWPPTNAVSEWSDIYIWIAGGDPERPAPFPAPLTKGADIISNSIGVVDFPISGIMKDTFDYIAAYGRNGRGCIVAFAAGNDNIDMATDSYSQWANYEKTIAVASCTISPPDAIEQKVSTSSFGDAIDLCAPAGGPAGGTEARTLSTGSSNSYQTHGQTSCACPQVAGAAALLLSVNPDLSWIEVRQILRDAAEHINTTNVDPDGIWRDVNGTESTAPGYLGPYHSRWYGYGMVNAEAAVQAAQDLVGVSPLTYIDTWIKENDADVGDVPCQPPYSPDVWVRNLSPATDDPAHVTEHQSPIRGKDNWVYANIRNRGAVDSNDVYARIMITRWAGTQYVYPQDFIPTATPSTIPTVMAPGTYLIGEVHIPSIPAHGSVTVNTKWVKELIPPESVTIGGTTYSWADSCLLVDISPHDGAAPSGIHTWDNNNLCQRNISIVGPFPEGADTFAFAFVVGHRINKGGLLNLNIERHTMPPEVELFVDYIDIAAAKDVAHYLDEFKRRPLALETCDLTILSETKGKIRSAKTGETVPVYIAPDTVFTVPCLPPHAKRVEYNLRPEVEVRPTVFRLPVARKAYAPVLSKNGGYQIVAILGKGIDKLKHGNYQLDIYQEDPTGQLDGGINVVIQKK